MKYTVVWEPAAERKLAELWNAGPDRADITMAADAIDRVLGRDASTQGEARDGNTRILIRSPLAVYFEVREADCLVSVYAVWRWSA
jgi:hypothetical protein